MSGPDCVGLGPYPVWRKTRIVQKKLSRYTCSDLVPLGMKWACTCLCWKKTRVSLTTASVAGALLAGLLVVINYRLFGKGCVVCRHRRRRRQPRLRRGRGLLSVCVFCPGAVGLVVVVVVMEGCGSYWLFEAAAHKAAFHGVPFQAILRRGEPGRAVREIAVASGDSGWL